MFFGLTLSFCLKEFRFCTVSMKPSPIILENVNIGWRLFIYLNAILADSELFGTHTFQRDFKYQVLLPSRESSPICYPFDVCLNTSESKLTQLRDSPLSVYFEFAVPLRASFMITSSNKISFVCRFWMKLLVVKVLPYTPFSFSSEPSPLILVSYFFFLLSFLWFKYSILFVHCQQFFSTF